MNERKAILKSYAEWTALSALRSGAPIKSRADVYPLIAKVDFQQVLDTSKGKIAAQEFEKWHKKALETLIAGSPKLKDQYGWAAKIINVYLKTYCYIGDGGREGIRECLHPPIDSGLWKGVRKRFWNKKVILANTHAVETIAAINTHELYLRLIKGFRAATANLNCSLIEIEQLWEGAGNA